MKSVLKMHSAGGAAWRMLILLVCCFTFLARPAGSLVYETVDAAYDQLFSIHAGMDLPSFGMETPLPSRAPVW